MSDISEMNDVDESPINEFEEISEDVLENLSVDNLEDIDKSESMYDLAIENILSEMTLDELYSLRNSINDTDEEPEQKVLKLR